MQKNGTVSFVDSVRIHDIVERQNWPLTESQKETLCERMMQRCVYLADAEQVELFLKLSESYQWVDLDTCLQKLIQLLEDVVGAYFQKNLANIFIFPIKKEQDAPYIKSSDMVAYLTRAVQVGYSEILMNRTFFILKDLDQVHAKKEQILEERPLLLVDDFIGTGKYTCDVMHELSNRGISSKQVVICPLFISEKGLAELRKRHYQVRYGEVVKSALSELSPRELQLLKQIETRLDVPAEEQLGYGGSANLISLIRTPNNTLPMFYRRRKKNLAPFPRF